MHLLGGPGKFSRMAISASCQISDYELQFSNRRAMSDLRAFPAQTFPTQARGILKRIWLEGLTLNRQVNRRVRGQIRSTKPKQATRSEPLSWSHQLEPLTKRWDLLNSASSSNLQALQLERPENFGELNNSSSSVRLPMHRSGRLLAKLEKSNKNDFYFEYIWKINTVESRNKSQESQTLAYETFGGSPRRRSRTEGLVCKR